VVYFYSGAYICIRYLHLWTWPDILPDLFVWLIAMINERIIPNPLIER
jgi:hypothetical protein